MAEFGEKRPETGKKNGSESIARLLPSRQHISRSLCVTSNRLIKLEFAPTTLRLSFSTPRSRQLPEGPFRLRNPTTPIFLTPLSVENWVLFTGSPDQSASIDLVI